MDSESLTQIHSITNDSEEHTIRRKRGQLLIRVSHSII